MSQSKRDQLHRLLNTRAQIKDELSYYTMFSRSGPAASSDRMKLPKVKSRTGRRTMQKDRDVMSIVEAALNTPSNQMVMPFTATSGAPKGVIKLPIFRLPAATAMPVLHHAVSHHGTRDSIRPIVPFIAYGDGRAMIKTLLHFIQHLSPLEKSYIEQYLSLDSHDIADCEDFLRKSLVKDLPGTPSNMSTTMIPGNRPRIDYFAELVPRGDVSIFNTARQFMTSAPSSSSQSQSHQHPRKESLQQLASHIDLVQLGFSQSLKDFLVSERIVNALQSDSFGHNASQSTMMASRSLDPYAIKIPTKGLGGKLESKTLRLRPLHPPAATSLARTSSAPSSSAVSSLEDSLLSADPNELTKALVSSLTTVQKHALKLKKTLEAAQSVVSVQDSKAKHLMNMIGAERIFKALNVILRAERRRGWIAWRLFLYQRAREARLRSLLRLLAVRNVVMGLHQGIHRGFHHFLSTWKQFTLTENQRLRRKKILDSTVLIQSAMRRFLARRRVGILRQRKKYEKLYDSTLKIQSVLRGKRIRWRYLALLREMKQGRAAVTIQRMYRGYRGRRQAAWARFKKNRHGAAVLIQNMVRSRIAHIRVAALRRARNERVAATKMQALIRGFVARKNIATIIINRARYQYAVRIQALIRGALTRMNRGRKIKEIQEYKATRQKAAVMIQAAYRGYRSRILYRLMVFQWKQERDRLHRASTQISRIIRGFLARCYLRDLKRERRDRWIAQARQWQEMWSEDDQAWFYQSVATGEAIWEPTRDGYVKFDGKLVLTSGEIIDDPLTTEEAAIVAGQDQQREKEATKHKSSKPLCTECNDRIAIRKCQECGDIFCTKCYKQLHALGARRHHTFIALGPRDCDECELVLAERYCVSCDECFCDGCWRSLHSHGKRAFHPYSEVAPDGRIDSRIYTMDGDQLAANYDVSAYTQARSDAANASALAATAQAQVDAYSQVIDRPVAHYDYSSESGYDYSGEQAALVPVDGTSSDDYGSYDWASANAVVPGDEVWTEYYDDQGYPYYYNNVTGESQYENPYT